MKTALRNNSLALFFGLIFIVALIGQALTGVAEYNNQQIVEGLQQITLGEYITSSSFAVDVAENWQSEYLQFFLYTIGTVWLVQQGSPESKAVDKQGTESDKEQKVADHAGPDSPLWARRRGLKLGLYSRSLGIVMGLIFAASWFAQSIAGHAAANEQRLNQLQDPASYLNYLFSAEFWNRTLQNWQPEFLAVGSMVVLSIYLRQRGSPESKPAGSPHSATGIEG